MTDLESQFCWIYAKTFDEALAYRKAGYKVASETQARQQGRKLLGRSHIRNYLNEIITLSPATILNQLIGIGMAQITDVISVNKAGDCNLLATEEWTERSRSAVKSIKIRKQSRVDEHGNESESSSIDIVMHDKLGAIDRLLKILQVMPPSGDVLGAVQVLANNDLILPAQAKLVSDGIEGIKDGLRQMTIWEAIG